jgi:signal transduction histidine kinase
VQVIAIDITARKQYEADLRGYSHRLIELDENLRKHLAAELHDEIGRDLTAIGMNLAVIGTGVADTEPVKVGEKIRDTVKLTENISRTVRGIMAGLRPPVLDDFGLLAALRWHSRSFSERTGVVIDVLADDSFPRLAAEKETALFRIAQEALMNAAKHADVHSVTIMLKVSDETIRLAIADQGNGFMAGIAGDSPRDGSGWGLKIMRERAEAIGGHFQVESAAGGGTAVTVIVAVKEA